MNMMKIAAAAISRMMKRADTQFAIGLGPTRKPVLSRKVSYTPVKGPIQKKSLGIGTYADASRPTSIYGEVARRYPVGSMAYNIGQLGQSKMMSLAGMQEDPRRDISWDDQLRVRRYQAANAVKQFAPNASPRDAEALNEYFQNCGAINARTMRLRGHLPPVGSSYPMSPAVRRYMQRQSPQQWEDLRQVSNTITKASVPRPAGTGGTLIG